MSSEIPRPSPVLGSGEHRQKVTEALRQAEQYRQDHQHEKGVDLLLDALQYGIDKAQIYYRMGNLYFDSNKIGHAEYAYRKAIELEPNHVNAHHNLSVIFRKQGKVSESVKFRKKASSLARRHPEQVKMNPEQVQYTRGYARRWLMWAVVILGVIIVSFMLFVR